DKVVLNNVAFDIREGEFVYLIGRTGSGKTSLLKTLYGDLPLTKGQVKIAGFELQKLTDKQIPFLRRKIGIVFQDFQLFYDRNINENLTFVMKATGWKDRAAMKKRISEVLIHVGLIGSGDKYPHQLSGGEQQRIVIARALLNQPRLLIADEPTGNLDPRVAEEILELFLEISKTNNMAILMATHNFKFLEKYPARMLKCEQGMVLDSGT
ncbi:MAG: ATP-binding cassette domain-containing protein, partial [Verrucomicrobia bacterium]|nr:ATP-binding cassette domain-containing protein [Cytophagales bacterium]